MIESPNKRPAYRNINVFHDVISYRLPPAGLVSILHRISGLLLFIFLPFIIWIFDTSITSELSFDRLTGAFGSGIGVFPGWFLKLIGLVLIWAFLHHFFAGLRHLRMDTSHAAVSLKNGRITAIATLAISLALTLILGAKLFGLY